MRLAQDHALWTQVARLHAADLQDLLGPACLHVHHIGSTAVPDLPARPIIDLIPVVSDLVAANAARPALEAAGYEWMGEYGLPGRRYLRRIDPNTGDRRVHAHIYAKGHADIDRHLAFRDHLRKDAGARATYAARKAACLAAHPTDHAAYGACKSELIDALERVALERYPQ